MTYKVTVMNNLLTYAHVDHILIYLMKKVFHSWVDRLHLWN